MANRYWVGNGGDWVTSGSVHWSTTSGGAPGASTPTEFDDVFFDENSFTLPGQAVDLNVSFLKCRNMDWTGALHTPALIGPLYGIEIYGSVTLIAAMTVTPMLIYLVGTGTLTTNGAILNTPVWMSSGTPSYALQDDLTINSALLVNVGEFDSGGKNISVAGFTSSGSEARTLTLGASTITCSGDVVITAGGLTMTPNTAKLVMTGASKTFNGNGGTFHTLEIRGSNTVINGSNTVHNLTLTAGTAVSIAAMTTQTVATWSGNGGAESFITLRSTSAGTPYTINCASGFIQKVHYAISDCIATGGASFAAYGSTDAGGNTGWEFLDLAAVPVYPVSETVVIDGDVSFEWDFPSELQTHYDLDISTNGVVWTPYAAKIESADNECVIMEGTLASRIYYWRVRAYYNDGTAVSEYAQASFVAVINPETSDVSCDGKPRPTVTWTASDQQAVQIALGDYDTGTVYTSEGSYTIPRYFDNGTYAVRVRTQTSLGAWSAWTETSYTEITNIPGDAITLTTAPSGEAINAAWFTAGAYELYYVYRNGVLIAQVDDIAYADHFAYGTSIYSVRGVLPDGYYTMSNDAEITLTLDHDVLSPVSAIRWFPLKHSLGSPVTRGYSRSADVTYLRFAGRDYPIPATGGFKNRKGSFSYAFRTRAEIDDIMDAAGKTVIHKDTIGNRIIGIINDLSVTYSGKKYYQLAFSITEIDYNEAVSDD